MDSDPPNARPHRNPQYPASARFGQTPLVDSMTIQDRPAYTPRGNPVVPADPGTPRSRVVALVLAVVLAGTAILWQNLGPDRQGRLVGAPESSSVLAEGATEHAPGGMTELMARAFLRVRGIMVPNQSTDELSALVEQIASTEATEADRVRTTIVAAEYLGVDAALARINEHRAELLAEDATEPLEENGQGAADDQAARDNRALILTELDALETVYTEGADTVDPDARRQLEARYGRLGSFALSHGQLRRERDAIVGGPVLPLLFGLGVAGLGAFGAFTGMVLLVWGMIWYGDRRSPMRCPKPLPGGSVMLETYALFVGCFVVLMIGGKIAEAHAGETAMGFIALLQLLVQWGLLLVVLWPLARGMRPHDWRLALGLTRGEGVGREMVCGLLAYLAFIPLYICGVLATVVLGLLAAWVRERLGMGEAPPPSNPVLEMVAMRDPFVLILIFTLATVWAPLAEELIFRGALYRHFRGRGHWVVAALGTAVLFAFLHSYGPLMVTPLIVLGFAFAFMREWRGSIIASMTAHFLHNFTVLSILITAFAILG